MKHKLKIIVGFAAPFFANGAAWAMANRPADPSAPPPPVWVQGAPILVMIGVFYFLLIRPQMRQRKERDVLMNNLKKGDKIVTQGGFFATIVNVGPQILEVKLTDDVKVKMQRSGVVEVVAQGADQEKEVEVVEAGTPK